VRAATGGARARCTDEAGTGIVASDIHIALVDFLWPKACVEVFDLRTIGLCWRLHCVFVADTEDFVSLPLAYSTTEKSNSRRQTKSMTSAFVEGAVGVGRDGGPTKAS